MSPLVSVLIPCFNAEKYVGEAIESALAQTHPNVEVVVVDDGSTDGSAEVIGAFGDRITAEFGPNRGACAARNRALTLSHGEFIQFLDADDLLRQNKVARQLPHLLDGVADLVFCRGYIFGDGRPERPKKAVIHSLVGDPFVYCMRQSISSLAPLHCRAALERVGGFRVGVSRGQEADLHLRLAASGARFAFLDELLYSVRNHDGPRITRTPQPPDAHLLRLLELTDLLEGAPYDLTVERRAALAGILFEQSIGSYRGGAVAVAARGFRRARQLARSFDYAERHWYKLGARAVGPLNMERALALGRCLRGLFRILT